MIWITLDLVTTDVEAAIFGGLYNQCLTHIPHTQGRATEADFILWWRTLDTTKKIYIIRQHTCFGCLCPTIGIAFVESHEGVTTVQTYIQTDWDHLFVDIFTKIEELYPNTTILTSLLNKHKNWIELLVEMGFKAEVDQNITTLQYGQS